MVTIKKDNELFDKVYNEILSGYSTVGFSAVTKDKELISGEK